MNDSNIRMNAEYQRAVAAMVGREVFFNLSQFIYEMAQHSECFPDYEDDLSEAYCGPVDYCQFAADHARREQTIEEVREWMRDYRGFDVECDDEDLFDVLATDEEEAREYCENYWVDCEPREVFEHWAVSNWLAARLDERGEKIIDDFMGNQIWCRCTTGQAISIDSVICDIYDDSIKPRTEFVRFNPSE